MVSVSDSRRGGCEFDMRLRRTFFLAYFCFSPLKHVRNGIGGFGKKIMLALVSESQEAHVGKVQRVLVTFFYSSQNKFQGLSCI